MSTLDEAPAVPGNRDRTDLLRRAVRELKTARAELAVARARTREPVAVVGMGCRFPGGADGVEAFWDLLVSGGNAIGPIPPGRWDAAGFHDDDPDAPGRTYAAHGGFLPDEQVHGFDPAVFGIPPREAAAVDPQHRLMLEVAWEALEHAGIAPDSLRGSRTGVFVGMGGSDYERLALTTGEPEEIDAYAATGGAGNFAANRLSYVLGLEGPSLVVDTACSSSLVAVHLAVQALRNGECDLAIVGGVNLLLTPGPMIALAKGRMLSVAGQCRTFDAAADGYVRGEGCGVVVLRRESTAQTSGERAHALIRGSAVNQDGRSSGLTVPRSSAQQDVVRQALAAGGVAPAEVGYVEAHGTGTPLGDPIEVRALARVLGAGREGRPLALGSVKTNLGHLEAAAGMAGLIKSVLMVERGTFPPHLHLSTPNPHIAWDDLPVTVPTTLTPWDGGPRVAGVSAFGFGGTNAHVVLGEAGAGAGTVAVATGPPDAPWPLAVKLAAEGPAALAAAAGRLADVVAEGGVDPVALAWTAGAARADLSRRAVVVASGPDELLAGLRAVAADPEGGTRPDPDGVTVLRGRRSGSVPRVTFTVPDVPDPAMLAGLATGLAARFPLLAQRLGTDEAAAALLDGSPSRRETMRDPRVSGPALHALAVGLGRWWASIGVEPDVVAGFGAGGSAAAVLAGVTGPEEGARRAGQVSSGPPRWTAHLPTGAVTGPATAVEGEGPHTVSLVPGPGAPVADLLTAVARLWTAGVPVDWSAVLTRPARPATLPTYPFQRTRHWRHGLPSRVSRRAAVPSPTADPLTPRVVETAAGEFVGEVDLSLAAVPFLAEHRVHGRLLVPGVAHLELVLRVAERALGGDVTLEDLTISRPLVLGEDETRTVQVLLTGSGDRRRVRVFGRHPTEGWQVHLEVTARRRGDLAAPEAESAAGPGTGTTGWDADAFYRHAWHPSFVLGESFRLVRAARRGAGTATGDLVLPDPGALGTAAGVRTELLVLDACVQLVAVAALDGEDRDRPVHLGTGYERIELYRDVFTAPLTATAVVRAGTATGGLVGDVTLTGPDGVPVARMSGVAFRPITGPMLERMVAEARPGTPRRLRVPGPDREALLGAGREARRDVVAEHLTALLAAILGSGPDDVPDDVPVPDLADSLMLAELKGEVDDAYQVSLPMEALFDDGSIRGLAGWVADELTPAPAAAPAAPARGTRTAGSVMSRMLRRMDVAEMTALAELEEEIEPVMPAGLPDPTADVLLTGATGFVGAFLLKELLERRSGDVLALVRADDEAAAMRRITANLAAYGVDLGEALSRVRPVVGDLTAPGLGLAPADLAALPRRIGDIVHCGAAVKWTYPYAGLAPANVEGTRQVLRLATAGRALPVHFVSTVGVFSSPDHGAETVTEDTPLEAAVSLSVGYAQTKWVAERMVRHAADRGVPTTIHRINTGWHSGTGSFNRSDHLSMMLKGCIEAGLAPDSADMPLQPAPIDHVAAAIAHLTTDPAAVNGTFHLVNPHRHDWVELFDAVEAFGYPLERTSFTDWRGRVTASGSGTLALMGLAPFLDAAEGQVRLPRSAADVTRAALAGSGIECPPVDDALVGTVLRRMASTGFIDPTSPRRAS